MLVLFFSVVGTFGPVVLGYFFFLEYVNLLSLVILAILVTIGEHIWATGHNIAMELRE